MAGPLAAFVDWFRTGPDRARLADPERVRRTYERRRWSVFLSVTLGYGVFYVGRINLSVVKAPLIDAGVVDAGDLGLIGSAMLVVYAVGKALNGFLADRSNIRRFMSAALLGSAIVNLVLGWSAGFVAMLALWGLNGWFQSVGSAPSVAAMSHWFSFRERGTRYGFWSISHNLGEGFTFVATSALVAAAGWEWGFLGPGLLCGAAALVLFRTLADRPETYGLPPVAEYRNDPSPAKSSGGSVAALQAEVLRSPAVWVLSLASAAMYVARYGVNSWGMLYLQKGKGYELWEAGTVLSAAPFTAMAGAIAAGWVSDRFFKSDRMIPALLFGLAEVLSLVAVWLCPWRALWIDAVAMGVFGFALGGLLVYLGGLMAVDVVSHRAAGAAMGIVGLFSYAGAAIQDTVSGFLIEGGRSVVDGVETYAFDTAFVFWIGASILSLALVAGLWIGKRMVPRERAGDMVVSG